MNRTLAVVVTYNRITMLKTCIEHIKAQTAGCDILIVDNASTDGTGAWAQTFAVDAQSACAISKAPCDDAKNDPAGSPEQKILYLNTGANLGGAGGFQIGIRYACEHGYTYVWIMDDDAFAEEDCLEQLLTAASRLSEANGTDCPFGFLSSAVLWKDGSVCKMNWQRKLHLPKERSKHHVTDADIKKQEPILLQSATFVSAFFPTAVIRRVGLPIREFFIWCDDIEFTRRIALKYQLPCYLIPTSRIVHHIANNVGTDLATDDAGRIDRYNYAFRNENYMYRQYGLKGFCYYILVCGYNTFKILKNAPDHKGKRLGVVFRNFFTGLFFNPPIEKL